MPDIDPIDAFRREMASHGLMPNEIHADGKIHRFSVDGERGKSGWYSLFVDGIPAGCYGNWRSGLSEKWCSKKRSELTDEQWANQQQRMAQAKKLRDKTQAERHAKARVKAVAAWNSAKPAPAHHPYLTRKKVKPYGARVDTAGKLLVPLYQFTDGGTFELWAVQEIMPKGVFAHSDCDKNFPSGSKKRGGFFPIGDTDGDGPLCFCEGFSTAAAIHQATSTPVICAFDASNLDPVLKDWRSLHPHRRLIICGDDDRWTTGNPGKTKAMAAGKKYACRVVFPVFKDLTSKPTDFNDLAVLQGFESVMEQVTIASAADRPSIETKDVIAAAFDDQKGCANLFIRLNKERFCFDHAANLWYRFDAHYWVVEDIGTPIKQIDELQLLFKLAEAGLAGEITLIGQEEKQTTEDTKRLTLTAKCRTLKAKSKTVKAIIKKLNTLIFRKQVVEFAAQGPGTLGISGSEWDCSPWELACKNGVVDLKTGYLRPGQPCDYIKSPCLTEYDLKAECPKFLQFLSEIFNDDGELVEFIQRILGMGLIGSSFQKQYLIILTGQGRNGKDTLLSVVGHVLGPHLAGPIAPEMLLDNGKFGRRSSSGPTPDVMRLRGLRIVWASETSQGRRFDAGKAKQLTGGGSIVGRPPYGRHEIEFEQSHLIILLTNHRPHAPVDDYAFWKRIRTVPFTQSFVDDPQAVNEHKVDKNILVKLKKESSGILRWMAKGCLAYQHDGLNHPVEVRAANEDYRRSEDTLQDFIDEECFIHPNASCQSSRLYQRYKAWASEGGIKAMSHKAFGEQMGRRFKKRTSNGVIYEGVGLVTRNEWRPERT
jgi:putative DNA primase/helicase